MWKKLCAAVAGLGLTVGNAQAAEPDVPTKGFFAVEQLPDLNPKPARLRLLATLRAPQLPRPGEPLTDPDFRGPIFRTEPLQPGQPVVQAGSDDLPLKRLPDLGPATVPPMMPPGMPGSAPVMQAGVLRLADGSVLIPAGTTPEGETIYQPGTAVPGRPANPVARHPANFNFGSTADPRRRVWGSAEVLVGMTRRVRVPAVVTTGPVAAGFGTAGAIGAPGTVPLFGGGGMLDDWRAGLRAELGAWLDTDHDWSATGRFYTLFSTSDQLVGAGNGTNVVNVPHFVPIGPLRFQLPVYVGFPGVMTGTVSTTAQTSFAGGDLSLRRQLYQGPTVRVDGLFGYRQLHLGDELGVNFREVLAGLPAFIAPNLTGSDSVRSRNNFYGGNLGVVGSVAGNRWSLEGLTAVSLGVNVSDVDYARNRAVALGFITSIPLTQINSRDRTTYFGVAVESGVKVGYQISSHAKFTFGYTGLHWSSLRRAPEQFTSSVALNTRTTSLYAHMLSWGVEFRY